VKYAAHVKLLRSEVFSFGERKGVGVADYLNKSPQAIPQLPQRGNFTWR